LDDDQAELRVSATKGKSANKRGAL
jgi:hypothetical protein